MNPQYERVFLLYVITVSESHLDQQLFLIYRIFSYIGVLLLLKMLQKRARRKKLGEKKKERKGSEQLNRKKNILM